MTKSLLPWQILRNGLYRGDLLGVGGNGLASVEPLLEPFRREEITSIYPSSGQMLHKFSCY